MIAVYLQGLSLGLAYVAPIGMQNLFVINSAMNQKIGRALLTALVVVFWDISLALACFFGAGALIQTLPWLEKIIIGVGGLLVIYIGVGLIRAKATLSDEKKLETNQPLWKDFGSAFIVLNPQALIDGTLMLGAFSASLETSSEPYFILGFASASFIWFNALAILVNLLGSKINSKVLTWMNRICGVVIVLYGLKLLVSLLQIFIKYYKQYLYF